MEHSQERDRVARPTLSWRTDRHTQCGRAADDVSSVISIDDLEARIQRATDRANREDQLPDVLVTSRDAARWEINPIGVVAREAARASIGSREPSSRPEAFGSPGNSES